MQQSIIDREDPAVEKEGHRRVGICGGTLHMGLRYAAVAAISVLSPGDSYLSWLTCEDYFDYRTRLRDQQVARGLRIPPKKALCSRRRRGRKFKG